MVNLPMLEGFLKEHKKIGLDSNIFIYFIEANPSYHHLTIKLFESIEKGRNLGICSSLSLLEVLVQPYRRKNEELVNQFYALMTTFPNLIWKDLTLEIADLGARLRAHYSIKTPDAILLATAIQSGATGFIGNDLQLKKVQEIQTLVLG